MTHCTRTVAACGKIDRAGAGRGRWAIRERAIRLGKARRVMHQIIEKIEARPQRQICASPPMTQLRAES